MNGNTGNPFSPRAVLAMLVVGALAFLLTLYFIGMGETGDPASDGGGHAAATGLNGYAGLYRLVEASGHPVELNRNEGRLSQAELLILTPSHYADGEELARIVGQRRYVGMTLVILPKWQAAPAPTWQKDAKKGWVTLEGTGSPEWKGFADDISVAIRPARGGWEGYDLAGRMPQVNAVQSGKGPGLVPLVEDTDGRMLAAYRADDDEDAYATIFVFEPDLLNNYGLARKENALLAMALIDDISGGEPIPVMFDLTQNGLGRSANLLNLAFTPPFLAATICLIIAGVIVGWRALRRFGPPLAEARTIALGKRQLVSNSAGFIRRTGRLHLLGPPYAALMRGRIARLLGLHRQQGDGALDAEIDRRLAARGAQSAPFTQLAQQLRNARKAHDLVRAAQGLKQIERTLEQ